MNVFKLNAINSTNLYLKELLQKKDLENFTIVMTEYQTSGKGQGLNIWYSEEGKNLLFSVLVKFDGLEIQKAPYLNYAISIAIYNVLNTYLNNVKIKWPNDIMAENKKVCGILIENTVRSAKINHSIIGIGLNVNQSIFPDNVKNATSIYSLLHQKIDRNLLLENLVKSIKDKIIRLNNQEFSYLKDIYESVMYKHNEISSFKDKNGIQFQGKIVGVNHLGMLAIKTIENKIYTFANKEIVYL